MSLDIERVWFIECWRCSSNEEANFETADDARKYFERQGWAKDSGGFQMCPQCWGPTVPAVLGDLSKFSPRP